MNRDSAPPLPPVVPAAPPAVRPGAGVPDGASLPPAPDLPPPPPRAGAGTHLFLLACIATVVAVAAWSTMGELDVVSNAQGEVVPSSQVKSVQHLEGGIVREILVKEGESVVRDEPLIILEPTKSGADVDELRVRLDSLAAAGARLEAEVADAAGPTFPPRLGERRPDLAREAEALFRIRRGRLENQLAAHREQIIQREQEIKEVHVRLRNNTRALKFVREQLEISEKLLKLNLTNRMGHLELLKEQAKLEGGIEADSAALPRTEAALKEARAQMASVRSAFHEDARKELDETLRTGAELTQRLKKLEDTLGRTVLRSPVDGIVKTLYIVTAGGVVQPGSTVVDIVPGGDRLVVEARLPTQDIGYVRPGQPATLQLASADAARFGHLDGTVVGISPDTLVTKQGVPFYKVRIEPRSDHFERGNLRYNLFPGMQLNCAIRTGTRTVLAYLLDPYIASMRVALREP